jgi:hypothetical protein
VARPFDPNEEETMPDGPNRNRTFGLVALALALVAAAGVGGYLIGHSAADTSKAKRDGVKQGRAEVQARYAPGASGYQTIYQAGQSAGRAAGTRTGEALGVRRGERVGLEQGHAAGVHQGQTQGVQTGAQAALGNLSNWETGAFYIVKLVPGTLKGVSYQVQGRNLMQGNRLYEICTDNPGEVCSRPALLTP